MGYALAPQIHLATTLLIERPAKSLVDMAKHAVWTKAETLAGHRTSIDVRDGNGALLQHSRLNNKTINYEGPIMTVWAGLAPFVNTASTIPLYGIVAFVPDDESREQQKFQALHPLSFHMHQQMCRDGRESKSANIQERRPSEERRWKQKQCGQDTRN
jgi:hypothetical protein